jgi:hypothetical protein
LCRSPRSGRGRTVTSSRRRGSSRAPAAWRGRCPHPRAEEDVAGGGSFLLPCAAARRRGHGSQAAPRRMGRRLVRRARPTSSATVQVEGGRGEPRGARARAGPGRAGRRRAAPRRRSRHHARGLRAGRVLPAARGAGSGAGHDGAAAELARRPHPAGARRAPRARHPPPDRAGVRAVEARVPEPARRTAHGGHGAPHRGDALRTVRRGDRRGPRRRQPRARAVARAPPRRRREARRPRAGEGADDRGGPGVPPGGREGGRGLAGDRAHDAGGPPRRRGVRGDRRPTGPPRAPARGRSTAHAVRRPPPDEGGRGADRGAGAAARRAPRGPLPAGAGRARGAARRGDARGLQARAVPGGAGDLGERDGCPGTGPLPPDAEGHAPGPEARGPPGAPRPALAPPHVRLGPGEPRREPRVRPAADGPREHQHDGRRLRELAADRTAGRRLRAGRGPPRARWTPGGHLGGRGRRQLLSGQRGSRPATCSRRTCIRSRC